MFEFSTDRQFAPNSTRVVALRQQKQGIEARRRDIYDSHRHRTFALAYYMTGNEIEAEEILTGTFVRAFTSVEEPTGRDVDTALIEQLQQRSYLDNAAEAFLPAPSPSNTEALSRNIKRTELEEAIQYLPSADRLLFLLRDVEGYTPAAIAQLLQISESQVQRRLLTTRIQLRRILADAQDGEEKAA